jgi:hypothetical protein
MLFDIFYKFWKSLETLNYHFQYIDVLNHKNPVLQLDFSLHGIKFLISLSNL